MFSIFPSTDNSQESSFGIWHSKNEKVKLMTFKDAVGEGDFIINALHGAAVIPLIQSMNLSDFDNKIIMDTANPLDFSQGYPPALLPGLHNTNSLGEEIQKALPSSKVVKTLNTMWREVMINPAMINIGAHQNYICGNDKEAKEKVTDLLVSFGWRKEYIMDLGDITNARGTELVLLIWMRIYGIRGSGVFNMKIVE